MLKFLNRVFFCSLLFISPVSAAVTIVDDFERADVGIPSSPAVAVSIVDTEGDTLGKSLEIAWPLPHRLWVECAYTKPLPIAEVEPESAIALRLRAWVPSSPGVVAVAVRLVDSKHEIFQWTVKVPASPEAGWRDLVIPIDAAKPNGHWGGNNDGRVDYPLKLSGYAITFANDRIPAGRVLIDDVRVVPIPTISLETDRFPFIVNATGQSRCDLTISNPEENDIAVTVKGTLSQMYGQKTDVALSVTVPARGSAKVPLALGDRQPGIRWLDATVQFGKTAINYQSSFVIADPVERIGGSNDFLFGICSHTERHPLDIQEQEIQAAAAAGATVMRIGVAWVGLEPKPGEWQWEKQDRLVELAAKYGIETQPILGYGPSHAVAESLRAEQAQAYKDRKPDPWKITLFGPPELDPWRKYVRAMAERYKGRIRFYEIWNEPDLTFWLGTTEQYLALLRTAFTEIRAADPDARVMTGGFATVLHHAARENNPDLQERVLAEASDSFDIHAFHQHGPFTEFKTAVDGELRRIRSRMSQPRPLYFNETAISSAFGGEKMQAVTLVKKMTYAMAQGAMGYSWYDLRNDGTNAGDGEHNYGLVTSRFAPKASFAAYTEIARQLHGMKYIGELDLGPGRHAYAFNGARGRVIVSWNEDRNLSDLPLLFRGGAGVRAVDVMGVSRDLPTANGVTLFQPTTEPQYVVFPAGEGLPELAGPLVRFEGSPTAAVGEPLQVTAVLSNPRTSEAKVKLTWLDPTGKETTTTLNVPANGTASKAMTSKAATPRTLIHGMTLRYTVEGTSWTGSLRYSVPIARSVGDVPPDDRTPDWVLDTRGDLVSFTQADPALTALNWRGPDDLSARVWLWQADGALRVRVDVKDDIHVQNESPEMSWRGDGVQLAFQRPGDKEYFELGTARATDGTTLRASWAVAKGIDIKTATDLFSATTEPITGGLRYEFTLPKDNFGLTDDALAREGLRFNLVVNDNDGTVRESLMRIAPGLGESKDQNAFPVVYFKP